MPIKIDVSGPQGNAFAIMAQVKSILTQSDRLDEWEAIRERMMQGDYEHLKQVASEVTFDVLQFYNSRDDEDEDR